MTTEKAAEPVVEQAVVIPPAKTTAEPEVDWKAQAEQYKVEIQRLEKLAEGIRSQDLNILRQKEQGDLLRNVAEQQRLLAEAVRTQDWNTYDAKVKEQVDKMAEAQAATANELAVQEAIKELDALERESGTLLLQNGTWAPGFENVALFWRNGQHAKAVNEAHKVITKLAREATAAEKKASAKAVAEARTAAVKETEEKLGKFDLAAGPEAGGSGTVAEDKIDAAWVDWDRKHPNEKNPYDAQYRAILRR